MNAPLRLKIAQYLTSGFQGHLKALKEAGIIWNEDASDEENSAEERAAEAFLREAATAVLFVADQDERRLHADRTQGEYREAVGKLVDGLIEDLKVRPGWTQVAAETHLDAVVKTNEYVTTPELNRVVLEYGTHPWAYVVKRGHSIRAQDRVPWMTMAYECMRRDAIEELSRRPEFVRLEPGVRLTT